MLQEAGNASGAGEGVHVETDNGLGAVSEVVEVEEGSGAGIIQGADGEHGSADKEGGECGGEEEERKIAVDS